MKFSRWVILLGLLSVFLLYGQSINAQSGTTGWSRPADMTQPSREHGGNFPKLLCDPYGNVHLIYGSLPAPGYPADIYYRTDAGNTWSEPADVIAVKQPVAIRFDAAISPQTNTLHLIWLSAWINGQLYYSQVPLGEAGDPRAWSTPRPLASQVSNANNTGNATIAVDSAGNLHIVYGTYDETFTQLAVQHIVSRDNGQTWSQPVTIYSVATPIPSDIGARLALDEKDRIHVAITVRSQEYGLASEVGYLQSPDDGRTWGAYRKVSDKSTSFQGLSTLAVYTFGDNEVHLTWHDPRRLHQWSTDGGQTWTEPIEMMGLGAAFGGPNALTKDSVGNLYMVTATGDGVYSARFEGDHWGIPEQIDNRFIDPHGQDIITCQGNQLHVAYYDRTGDTRVWHSMRTVDAPHIDRQPIPQPAVTPQPTPTVIQPTLSPAQTSLDNQAGFKAPGQPDAFFPLIAALIPVALLLTGVVLIMWRRMH
jgi:hypothetical protein